MQGHTIVAPEGVNGTVAGSPADVAGWKALLEAKFGAIQWKEATAARTVFRRWIVRLKPEIVGLKKTDIVPAGRRRHLSPEEWQRALDEEDVVLVDARNDYEWSIGRFRDAPAPGIDAFHDFPAAVEKAAIPKDKKVLMYCTGGIRCEKALIEMERQGYQDVWQLEGGILAYLEKFPERSFEGECFVFDGRIAVDQKLEASARYELCPHCGYAGDLVISCHCGKTKKVCEACAAEERKRTCSKRCANLRQKHLIA
jgi:UPF0176 protein